MPASSSQEYTPYAQRPGWDDLTPVPQADAPNCLVPIAYSEPYRDAMSMFRALVKKGEKSERGLEVTETLIRLNPGHYSIWAYRAEILLEIKADLTKELDLMEALVKEHLKSYQVWQHRRTIVLALNDPSQELRFTSKALAIDAKNYHTWAYRQWTLLHFFKGEKEVWEGEIAYAEQLIEDDIRNNSAWNHRYFVTISSGEYTGSERDQREYEYVKSKLLISPNNPSAWNYLRGLCKTTQTPLATLVPFVTPLATAPHESEIPEPPISEHAELPAYLAIEFLADALAEEKAKKDEAAALYRSLTQFDPIRTKYWEYRARQVIVGATA